MKKDFVFDEEIENALKVIEQDDSLLDTLNVDELETINNYLIQKKSYLSGLGENNGSI